MQCSPRIYLYLILMVIILQLLLVLMNIYMQSKHYKLEKYQEVFTKNTYLFMENLTLEKYFETAPETRRIVQDRYAEIIDSQEIQVQQFNNSLLWQRRTYNEKLLNLIKERQQLHTTLNELLPELSKNVSYIHGHHLAYLKNSVRHVDYKEHFASKRNFSKKTSEPASELDILAAAISVQRSMLEIIEIFSRIQRGISPKIINNDYSTAIAGFYTSTNRFEVYSLDAQDGLLVEEIILNGNTFEKSLGKFLQLEQTILATQYSLSKSRKDRGTGNTRWWCNP